MVPLGNKRETKSLSSREAFAVLDSPSSSQFSRLKGQGARIGSGISGVEMGIGEISSFWRCVTMT